MTYTLHGRELKVGDKVWSLPARLWIEINGLYQLQQIDLSPSAYAWDECTYQSTLGAVPPPLGWVEGKPVRKGDVLYAGCEGEKWIASEFGCIQWHDFSWSPPKRTEQRWVAFSARAVIVACPLTEQEADIYRASDLQVFGPFEVEVK